MEVTGRLTELAKTTGAQVPVVSVYLNTRWADERQRQRVRVFLKNEISNARRHGKATDADLDWIQEQGEALINQALFRDACGIALFACEGLGLREILPVRVPFEDTFVVADAPVLHPLAALLEKIPSTLVVFVDGKGARLISLGAAGPGEELELESEVPGRHRRGGWAQLAQSRYQRHIQDHRGRHFEAVAEVLAELTKGNGVERIVVAGEVRTLTAFEKHLPSRIAARIVGRISGARHEPADVIVGRAEALLAELEGREELDAVNAVLTEAAKSGRAVAGLEETLEAVSRGAVHRLYILKGFSESGRVCVACGALQSGGSSTCRFCAQPAAQAQLGEAMVGRVIGSGGAVVTVGAHAGLASVGGVAASLRYPL